MFKKPWLQFLLLGLLLFFASARLFPEPKPVLGPPNAERLAAMEENYSRFARGEVSPEVRERFVETELRDELLFREALARDLQYRDAAVEQRIVRNMRFLDAETTDSDAVLIEQGYALRLHLTDEVIRRRLVQIMERLIVATADNLLPTSAQIEARYDAELESWQEPTRYSFSHVFLSSERADEMPELVARVEAGQLTPEDARLLGAPFLSGYEFRRQSRDQMTRVFGAVFAEQIESVTPVPGKWIGPIDSAFGKHYVYITDLEPPRTLPLEEVSVRIERDLVREAEAQRVTDWVEQAMSRYEVQRS